MKTSITALSEILLHTTIQIRTNTENGRSSGTGFFFAFKEDKIRNTNAPAIVTNKHVIENAVTGTLHFSIKDKNGQQIKDEFLDLEIDNFESRWIMHPDPNVDLCILPIGEIHLDLQKSGKDLFYYCLSESDFGDDEYYQNNFSHIEEVTIVGYPDGIWDHVNNLPIVRRGITATPLHSDFQGNPTFLIDASIYGGSSGSPVFVFNEGSYTVPDGNILLSSRVKLVGIVFAVALHNISGEFEIFDVPTSKKQMMNTAIPNNLGVVIHARKLLDFNNF